MNSSSKLKLCIIALISWSVLISCRKEESGDSSYSKMHFLVDKIYNYDSQLVAVYQYNSNHQLIRRSWMDPV